MSLTACLSPTCRAWKTHVHTNIDPRPFKPGLIQRQAAQTSRGRRRGADPYQPIGCSAYEGPEGILEDLEAGIHSESLANRPSGVQGYQGVDQRQPDEVVASAAAKAAKVEADPAPAYQSPPFHQERRSYDSNIRTWHEGLQHDWSSVSYGASRSSLVAGFRGARGNAQRLTQGTCGARLLTAQIQPPGTLDQE